MSSNDSIHFSRRQRTGIITLIVLVIAAFLLYRIYSSERSPENIALDQHEQQAWSDYSEKQTEENSTGNYKKDYNSQRYSQHNFDETAITDRSPFDPNTASKERLIAAGLPESVANTLVKFRNSGAKFYKVEDLKKVYGLREKYYERIAPFVKIERDNNSRYSASSYSKENNKYETNTVVEVNTANVDALVRLKGIGPGYANRIINYRDKLGGFTKVEQLKEVYGLPDSTYQQMMPMVKIDAQKIKRLNVNIASEEQLTNHPYIKKYLATGIIKLRNDLKVFKKIEDLRQVPLINEEKYRKIAPYLTVE